MLTEGLFSPLKQRGVTFRNRIGMSPMCMYSCDDGLVNDWHVVHLGSRAVGGCGLVIAEATGVEPRARITVGCAGMYRDEHVEAWSRVTRIISQHGAVPGIQLAHAGRKAGWSRPWPTYRYLGVDEGGWQPLAPSPIAPNEKHVVPREMTRSDIHNVTASFAHAAARAVAAGFGLIEIHAAHGYLLNSFCSPLTNHRTDEYGGTHAHRTRIHREVVRAVRKVIPDSMPLWMRISCSDWADDGCGWNIEDSVELAKEMRSLGVDLIDCSSGGNATQAKIPVGPGYQVPFADAIRRNAGIHTAAVGMITEAGQADAIIRQQQADMILLGKTLLRDPYFPVRAAKELGVNDKPLWPEQYRWVM